MRCRKRPPWTRYKPLERLSFVRTRVLKGLEGVWHLRDSSSGASLRRGFEGAKHLRSAPVRATRREHDVPPQEHSSTAGGTKCSRSRRSSGSDSSVTGLEHRERHVQSHAPAI